MNAIHIVTIVRTLIEAGQSDSDIAATLAMMGFAAIDNASTDQLERTIATRRASSGIAPSVTYKLKPGITAKRIAEMLPAGTRALQIAELIASAQTGITKREVLAAIREHEPEAKPGVAMSAIHGLQLRGIVVSVPLATVAKAKQVPSAVIRKPLTAKR